MTIQNYLQEGDKMLQIGVPIMCMRAVDKYIDAIKLTEKDDPIRILLYSRIAVANFKIPKLERALAIAEMGLKLCKEYENNSLLRLGEDILDRLGKSHLLYVKDQVSELYESLGTDYDKSPVDINERYFGNPESLKSEVRYPEDINTEKPISYSKALEVFQVMNLPGDMVNVINKKSKEVFGIQNGYLSSYSGDQDVENKKLYDRIMNNSPTDNINPSEYGRLERYKVADFIDAFEYYVSDNSHFIEILNSFKENVIDEDDNYYDVYCQAFIEEFTMYFNDRLVDHQLEKLNHYSDRAIIGSVKKIVGELL